MPYHFSMHWSILTIDCHNPNVKWAGSSNVHNCYYRLAYASAFASAAAAAVAPPHASHSHKRYGLRTTQRRVITANILPSVQIRYMRTIHFSSELHVSILITRNVAVFFLPVLLSLLLLLLLLFVSHCIAIYASQTTITLL